MQKIRQLDDVLANKIAAGEVIERPANVVKELVENSLDAGSTKIDIIIKDGGLELISIIDNGEGMSKADASLCFSRHATSKIKDDDDLFCIQTLGFRGEAIPSIASISDFVLETSNGNESTKVHYLFGKLQNNKQIAINQGTTITVTKLFQNVPARLKYMKSVNTEFSNIQSYIEKLSLSHSNVAFSLTHNDRMVFQSRATDNLLETVANVYGLQVAKSMIPVEFEDDEFKVVGYVSKIDTTRSSKKDIITMVNNRVVKSSVAIDAINNSYRKYLADNRYPIAIVNIEIDPYLVDVNVHPSKLEVRFSKETKLKELIYHGMIDELSKVNLTYDAIKPTMKIPIHQEEITFEYKNTNITNDEYSIELPDIKPKVKEEVVEYNVVKEEVVDTIVQQPEVEIRTMKQKIFVQGQVHGTYIIGQDQDTMYIIDQHAAQERINYEYFYSKFEKLDLTMQELLLPLTFEFPVSTCLLLEERKELLHNVGIDLIAFGENGFIVKELPFWMKNVDEKIFIDQMIDQLIQNNKVDVVEMQEHAIATLSCKASLKANLHLSTLAMQELVDNLMCCENPYVCPHGRPTIIKYRSYDLEKLFKRVV